MCDEDEDHLDAGDDDHDDQCDHQYDNKIAAIIKIENYLLHSHCVPPPFSPSPLSADSRGSPDSQDFSWLTLFLHLLLFLLLLILLILLILLLFQSLLV